MRIFLFILSLPFTTFAHEGPSFARLWDCQITVSGKGQAETSRIEIYGCVKPGKIYTVMWSNELEPIKSLASGSCTHFGKTVNEKGKIDVYPGTRKHFSMTLEPGRVNKLRRKGTIKNPEVIKKSLNTSVSCVMR